jgi:pectate lyase
MKKLLFLTTSVLLAACVQAQVALPFYDAFSYGAGTDLAGNGNWVAGSGSGTIKVNVSNLAYNGLATSAGNDVSIIPSSSSARTYVNFSQQIAGTVYFSFLLKVTNAPSAQRLIGYSYSTTSSSSTPYLGFFVTSGGQIAVGISTSSPQFTSSGLAIGSTNLIVVAYTFGFPSDRAVVWINPTSLGGSAPGSAGSFLAAHNSFLAYFHWNTPSAGTGGGSYEVDELRIGSSWASVTPTNGVVVPPPSGAPYITEVQMTPGGLVLRGTNGPANGAFDLLATTNLVFPISQWGEVASDNFDAGGQFDLTNPVAPGTVSQFFRLRVGSATPPPVAPAITTEPTNQMVLASQTAAFTVMASGTAPLHFQWYFNTNAVLDGATGSTLTLNNVQTNDAGSYSVIVTNSAGSATSMVATLTVSNITAAPSITTQPQDQTVIVGQTAVFSVGAAGTPPLSYQWYFNTNTLLADATNASLALNNVQTNDAGVYSVIVTNSLGVTNSVFATLTVTAASTNTPDFSHVGFGNNGTTVTGAGPNAPSVIVTTGEELNNYSDSNSNIVIYVSGTLQISGMSTHVRANKTIIGLGTNAILEGGGLYLYKSTNVIIRNLTIRDSTEDNIGLHYSSSVWIDHCTLYDSTDGNIDLTQESDNVTISWCKFFYTVNSGHDFVNLLGASDGETGSIGKLRVTFHHNWWSTLCTERMPSVRFGRAHVYNNYYNAPGNNYCVRSRLYAECRVENNAFENVKNPWEVYVTSGPPGLIYAAGNSFTNVTWTTNYLATDPVFAPPYSYTLDPAPAVPALVTTYAGAGKIAITP